jgi:LysM repeat protein
MNDKFTNDTNKMDEWLSQTVEGVNPNSQFASELEQSLRRAHRGKSSPSWFHFTRKQATATLAWTVSLIIFTLFMSWTIKLVAPSPTEAPASNQTVAPQPTDAPIINNETQVTPAPNGGYDWRDAKLYLNAPVPESPSQANIYLLKDETPATVEQAQALAQRFGIQGQVYVAKNPATDETDYFLVTDGKQSLTITTNRFFTYTADTSKVFNTFGGSYPPNAEAIINDFLLSRGFDFPHKITKDGLHGGYTVEPLSPDGYPMGYEYFTSRPMRVMLDEDGNVIQVEANLMDYESIGAQTYNIISAEDAFQKLMDDSVLAGKIESLHSPSVNMQQWSRQYPDNETITIYGYSLSIPALDPAQPAFIQIDGFTVTGNTVGMEALDRNTFVEATGQFVIVNDIRTFNIESWRDSPFAQDGMIGMLISENGQVILQTQDGERLPLEPQPPADVPLPFEDAFVVGVHRGDVYDWTLIDNRMSANGGGGGGGGGGLGFYQLNLSGTAVPFPEPTPIPQGGGGGGGQTYTVQAGDTLTSIAESHSVTVEELMQANGMTDSIIMIGQQLVIPGGAGQIQGPDIGKRFDNQRGTISIHIIRKADGSSRTEYTFATFVKGQIYYLRLTGETLDGLMQAQNRPVNIWATIEGVDDTGALIARVERFEIPFPDLQFKILRGTQQRVMLEGQSAILFNAEDGASYVQLAPDGNMNLNIIGNEGDQVLMETLAIPDEAFGGYPALRVFSASMAINPKDGQPLELTITADQINTLDEPIVVSETYTQPALIIEKIELMYYITNPHWQAGQVDGSPQYIQPVWRFYGHYENGDEFETIIQALKEEYLLPELAPYTQGG